MPKTKTKTFRPKARRPRGFEDKPLATLAAERALVDAACKVYRAWGFQELQTPAFEYADALGKFLPDADRPNAGVFALQDDDEQWMALRYDLTAPLARYVAEHYDRLPKPFRRFQVGSVWRNEKPGPGRFREFIQCDADTVAAPGPAADAEMIALAAAVMKAAGLKAGEYVVRYNDRRFLDSVLELIGVPDTSEGAATRLAVLRAIDKLDRLGLEGVEALLGDGRKDESGDYTEGAKLTATQIGPVLDFVRIGTERSGDRLRALKGRFLKGPASETFRAVYEEQAQLGDLLAAHGTGRAAAFDPSIVRGLDYYTGTVFEAELLLEIANEKGQPVRIGSVGGGGRYDDLVARFKGQEVPATGFSFGVSRFAAALALAKPAAAAHDNLAVVLALEPERMADYVEAAAEIRRTVKIPAEVYLGGSGMRAQLKYADRRNARFAVMIGEDERAAGQVTVKDLVRGAELAAGIETHDAYRDARPGQETIARDALAEWLKGALKPATRKARR